MDIELIATGLRFPEGPVAMTDGSVVLVEIAAGRVSRIAPDGSKHLVAKVGSGPNGAAVGPDGALYICNNGGYFGWHERDDGMLHVQGDQAASYAGGSIQRLDMSTGAVTTLYTEYKGQRLISPNDLVFDADGGFWFTDTGGSTPETLRYGSLYYAHADGSRLVRARRKLVTPNGVGLSPDGMTLYFAETMTGRLWACDVAAPGKLAPSASPARPGRLLATVPDYQFFDSLAVEQSGRVCVASLSPGGITVVSPDGAVEFVAVPDPVTTNLCFAGTEMRDAYITAASTGCLYRMRWPRPGLKLAFNA